SGAGRCAGSGSSLLLVAQRRLAALNRALGQLESGPLERTNRRRVVRLDHRIDVPYRGDTAQFVATGGEQAPTAALAAGGRAEADMSLGALGALELEAYLPDGRIVGGEPEEEPAAWIAEPRGQPPQMVLPGNRIARKGSRAHHRIVGPAEENLGVGFVHRPHD